MSRAGPQRVNEMCDPLHVSKQKRSRTAQGVCAERAILNAMGVLVDPFSEKMLTRPWSAFVTIMQHWPLRMNPWSVTRAGLAARILWHDAQISSALDDGITQVAVIGAGYDSRAWRMRRDGVQFFELDHPVTQHDKVARAPGPGPIYVEADLATADAADALRNHGLDASKPALFILEGVTMYLSETATRSQLHSLSQSSAVGSRLSVDFYPPANAGTASNRRQMRYQKFFRTGSGEQFRLVVDQADANALVAASGWEVTTTTNARAAALEFVPRSFGLPIDEVNEHKALLAATRR